MKTGARFGAAGLGLVLLAWLVSWLSKYDVVTDVHTEIAGAWPSTDHGLGADHLGRDVLQRLIGASRAFVGVGLLAAGVSLLVALPLGVLAGALGPWGAELCRAPMDLLGSIPRFVLVLLLTVIFGDEPRVLAVAAGLAWAPALSSELAARIQTLRHADFVEAACAHGLHPARIFLYHLLWVNGRRLVGRNLLQLFGFVLVLESTLSYIGGFGVVEPNPSWGNMLAFEFGISDGNPFAWAAPALAIWGTVLCTVLLADALREDGHAR